MYVATDWEHYAHEILDVLEAEPALENTAGAGAFASRGVRPVTRFEARGERLGHQVWDFAFRKREQPG